MSVGRVLIVGGGIGGLALAQGLKKHGHSFTVFERDASPVSRSQGYRIKVFPDTVADLKSVLTEQLLADFEATCAETGMGETTLSVHDASIIANRVNRFPSPIRLTAAASGMC
jgi:flavin-dependent dehydrogenase